MDDIVVTEGLQGMTYGGQDDCPCLLSYINGSLFIIYKPFNNVNYSLFFLPLSKGFIGHTVEPNSIRWYWKSPLLHIVHLYIFFFKYTNDHTACAFPGF